MKTNSFWISFAGYPTEVIASKPWQMYFQKYYQGTTVSISANKPGKIRAEAELTISDKITKPSVTAFSLVTQKDSYNVSISSFPHFFYPLINNILQRIYTAIFIKHNGMVIHGSAVKRNGMAHIFLGLSGSGKSTIAGLSESLYRFPVLADNHVFNKREGDKFYVYPFPFDTLHNRDTKGQNIPIAAAYIISKATVNSISGLSFTEALQQFKQNVQIQMHTEVNMQKILFSFLTSVKIYNLSFTKKGGFWETIYEDEKHRSLCPQS